MKQFILGACVLVGTILAQADVFESYQVSGRTALDLIKSEPTKADRIVTEINVMIEHGYAIMDRYQIKYSECTQQFAQLKQLSATIDQLSYEEIETLYHDGDGLVAAPRVCYKGRSLVVHPYQVIALAKEGRLDTDAAIVDHEMNEVIERAGVIKKDLEKK
jgi:hypothetical protein